MGGHIFLEWVEVILILFIIYDILKLRRVFYHPENEKIDTATQNGSPRR